MQDGELLRRTSDVRRRLGLILGLGLWQGLGQRRVLSLVLCAAGWLAASPTSAAEPRPAAAQEPPEASPGPPAPRPVFLVTEVDVAEGVPLDKDAARDTLSIRFGRLRDKVEVRSFGEVKSSLDKAALMQMLGDAAAEEIARLGEYVAVDRIVHGRIHVVGDVIEVQARLFNTREGVTELALARRLKSSAPPQLMLTLIDSIADGLLAFVLDTYTDGAPSAGFAALAQRKLDHAPRVVPPAPTPWSALGLVGAGLGGAGIVGAGIGVVSLAATPSPPDTALPMALGGAGAALVGAGLLVVDGLSE